jgi:heme exporter protein D
MTLVLATTAGNYVAAAYVVFLAIILIYLAIMATKVARIERELQTLNDIADQRDR